jgi:hypothetical protein
MSEAKVGLSATVWVEVVGLFMVVLDFVNAFGFVPLHVLKPAMRINVSINMLFGILHVTPVNLLQQCRLLRAQQAYQFVRVRNVAEKVIQCGGCCEFHIRGDAREREHCHAGCRITLDFGHSSAPDRPRIVFIVQTTRKPESVCDRNATFLRCK